MRLVLWHLASRPEQLAAHRPALLAAFVEHVVNAKTRAEPAALAAYGQLLVSPFELTRPCHCALLVPSNT